MSAARRRAHVALLRGVNVGGRQRLPMQRLVALLEELGFPGARTYVQSGNAVFEATAAEARALPARLAAAIERDAGFATAVLVRSAVELARIVRDNPFAAAGVDERELHVVFLSERPTARAVAALDPDPSPPDEYAVRGREAYLRCPRGVARTKLSVDFFGRVGGPATGRNWRTTRKLLELARGG